MAQTPGESISTTQSAGAQSLDGWFRDPAQSNPSSQASPAPAGGGLNAWFNEPKPAAAARAATIPTSAGPISSETLDQVAASEGLTAKQRQMMGVLLGQESDGGRNPQTSVDGARGAGQIMPATFQQYAKAGERIDDPASNLAVSARIIKDLGTRSGDDPARIATGYFSGPGNMNTGAGHAWRKDAADGNGKTVSSYVGDVLARLAGAQPAAAAEPAADPLATAPKWTAVAAKPEYQALSDADKQAAREAYFQRFVAPSVPQDQLQAYREAFDKKTAPAGPGMIAGAVDALGGARQAIREAAGTTDEQRRVDKLQRMGLDAGVMTKFAKETDTPAGQLPKQLQAIADLPATDEFKQQVRDQWAAADPATRKTLESAGGYRGFIAKQLGSIYGDAKIPTSAQVQGESTIGPTDFDFDAQKAYNDPKSFLSNPVVRGAVKGVEGFRTGALGMAQFAADTVGADDFAAAMRKEAKASGNKTTAMGEPQNAVQRNFEGAVSSIAQQLPALVGGAATGSEALVLGSMFTQTFGQEYGQAREAGKDVGDAAKRAAIFGAFEVAGEKLGLGEEFRLIQKAAKGQPTGVLSGWLANTAKKELPGELFTTTGEFLTDKADNIGLNKDASFSDYLDQMADTAVQTFMQSGVLGGGVHAAGEVANRFQSDNARAAGAADAARSTALNRWNTDGLSPGRAAEQAQAAPAATQSAAPPAAAARVEPTLGEDTSAPAPAAPATAAANTGIADQDVLDYADSRYRQLRAARDGEIAATQGEDGNITEGVVPGGGLSEADAAELALLQQNRGDARALAKQYGFDTSQPDSATVTAAANEAATSPENDRAAPTQAQKEAGNYKKGSVQLHGLDIAIENPQGSSRSGVSKDGRAWSNTLADHYGYVRGTVGADGDGVDVFVGPHPQSTKVFVIDQIDPQTGRFDEVKAMLGYDSQESADAAYHANHEAGWNGMGHMTEIPVDGFKAWLQDGDTSKPFGSGQFTAAAGEVPEAAALVQRQRAAMENYRAAAMSGDEHAAQVAGDELAAARVALNQARLNVADRAQGMLEEAVAAPAPKPKTEKQARQQRADKPVTTAIAKPAANAKQAAADAKHARQDEEVRKAAANIAARAAAKEQVATPAQTALIDQAVKSKIITPGSLRAERFRAGIMDATSGKAMRQDDRSYKEGHAWAMAKQAKVEPQTEPQNIQKSIPAKPKTEKAAKAARAEKAVKPKKSLADQRPAKADLPDLNNIDRNASRQELQTAARDAGLLTGQPNEVLRKKLGILQADPRTWTEDDLKTIANDLDMHQDTRAGSADRVEAIMRDGLPSGMTDNLGAVLNGGLSWAKKLHGGDVYLFPSRKLQYASKTSGWLAPGNLPLIHFKATPGQSIIAAINKTATRRGSSELNNIERQTVEVKGERRPITNSNGQLIAEDANKQLAFYRWFGNSKVVDKTGHPLVVYHGTAAQFDKFDHGRIDSINEGLGFYFTDNRDVAQGYGQPMQVYLQIEKPLAYDAKAFSKPVMSKIIERVAKLEAEANQADIADGFLSNFGDINYEGFGTVLSNATKLMTQDETANDQIAGMFGSGVNAEFVLRGVRDITGHDGIFADGFSNSGIGDNRIYVAWFPEQIKSATNNSGAFDVNNPSILADIDLTQDSPLARQSEPVRVNTLAKLKALEKKREAGKLTDAEYQLAIQSLIGKLETRADAQLEKKARPRERGELWLRERLLRAKRLGELSADQVDFALWALDKNPDIANDLGISLRESKGDGVAGSYIPGSRIISLVKGNGNMETVVHEIMHHTERMMPADVQHGIVKEWARAMTKAWKAGTPEVRKAIGYMMMSSIGDRAAHEKMMDAFRKGVLNYDDHYHLVNASEFWAVNASEILAKRADAAGRWVAQARQWLREMIEKIKNLLNLPSSAPVLAGLQRVLEGQGKRLSNSMLVEIGNADMSSLLGGITETARKERAHGPLNSLDLRTAAQKAQADLTEEFGKPTFSHIDWWDKSVGTQYHKAAKNPLFKKVYDLAIKRENAVSLTAVRAASLAPGFLPRVDDFMGAMRTLAQGRKTGTQTDLAGKALLEGTLAGGSVVEGKVWSTQELRDKGLNDQGIALYRQARDAIDASLDEVAAAEGYSTVHSFVPKSIREQVIDDPRSAQSVLSAALAKRIQLDELHLAAQQRNNASPAAVDAAKAKLMQSYEVRDTLAEIFDRADQLKRAGYTPLMRFGKYYVQVEEVDPQTGKTVINPDTGKPNSLYFSRFETEAEASAAYFREQVAHRGKDDIKVSSGPVNEESFKMFSGISPETLELFADVVGAKEATEKFYQVALSERSALKRRITRDSIEGYSENMPRVLANFITSNGKFAAQRYYTRDINNAIRYIPRLQGDVQKEAMRLKEYIDNPGNAGAIASALSFTWFLGGNVASALINATQPVMMTLPYLSQFGAGRAASELTKAAPYAMGRKQIMDADLKAALKRGAQEGKVDAQEIFHLYSVGIQGVASILSGKLSKLPLVGGKVQGAAESARARLNALGTLWGMPFAMVEGFNRRLTFIAAWNVAKSTGQADPYQFAVDAVDQTQGVYNKVNRPNWARSSVGRVVFTFAQFKIMNVEMLKRLATMGGPEGKKAAAMYLATLILAAGVSGLPYADDIDDIIDTVGQWLGYNTNMKRTKREWAYKTLGRGFGDLALYGVSAHLPVDFGGRMGLGNMFPATGILKPSGEGNRTQDIMELGGPAISGLGKQVFDAYDAASMGSYGKAAMAMMPSAVKNAAAGLEMATTGKAKDMKGRVKTDVTPGEGLAKAIGLNPTVVAEKNRANMPITQDLALQKLVESSIVDQWAQGAATGNQHDIDQAMARMKNWNEKNPDTPVAISANQIRAKVKTILTPTDTRMLKGAPKEMRGRVVEGLKKE